MGESGDQLQRTGSSTPPPAHALTIEKIKTKKQAVSLCFTINFVSTTGKVTE